jgi:hypothetical protein
VAESQREEADGGPCDVDGKVDGERVAIVLKHDEQRISSLRHEGHRRANLG